ncbi:MAG: iron donor protein CyaY [Acidobacteriota bacterium]
MSRFSLQQKMEEAILELERAFIRLAEDRDIDVESQGGVLTVTFEEAERGKFIISPNSSARQLWVSARMSSYKFDWSEERAIFVLAHSGEPIRDVMTRLAREQLGDDQISL